VICFVEDCFSGVPTPKRLCERDAMMLSRVIPNPGRRPRPP
jgi:hypothetical protein